MTRFSRKNALFGLGLTTALAGCGASSAQSPTTASPKPTGYVFVMNAGSQTISVINPVTNRVVKTINGQGMTLAPYPSNQYATGTGYVLSGWKRSLSILKVSGENVSLVKNIALPPSVTVRNGVKVHQIGVWQDITPNGQLGLVSVREAEQYLFIDMNPKSKTFGSVLATIDTRHMGPHGTGIGP